MILQYIHLKYAVPCGRYCIKILVWASSNNTPVTCINCKARFDAKGEILVHVPGYYYFPFSTTDNSSGTVR